MKEKNKLSGVRKDEVSMEYSEENNDSFLFLYRSFDLGARALHRFS